MGQKGALEASLIGYWTIDEQGEMGCAGRKIREPPAVQYSARPCKFTHPPNSQTVDLFSDKERDSPAEKRSSVCASVRNHNVDDDLLTDALR